MSNTTMLALTIAFGCFMAYQAATAVSSAVNATMARVNSALVQANHR